MPLRLGLIGFGGLGSVVAAHLARDERARFVAVAARPRQRERVRAVLGEVPVVDDADGLLARRPDLVIECASHGAFRQYAEPVLRAGADLLAVSSGVLADAGYRRRVLAAAEASGAGLQIPSGAIGAIDAVAAARHAGLKRVVYVTRKNARAWAGTPAERMVDLAAVREPTLFFDDTAERAAFIFTDKANVTATLALAGIGFEATRVRFWVDPGVTRSIHHIEAAGACGELKLEMFNTVVSPENNASFQTAMSIVQAVRNRSAALRF
ncbi:MAG: aspartate dehydrogenase [Burkholderiales bacterium]|nr:aspartate dehydrogenase [Burkholderiales bacterium]